MNCIKVGTGSLATATKSLGVKVIPMESMSAARPAVKYSVVNQAKDCGVFKAQSVKMTVHSGNKVVATLAVFV